METKKWPTPAPALQPQRKSPSGGLSSKESSWVHLAGEIKLFLNS